MESESPSPSPRRLGLCCADPVLWAALRDVLENYADSGPILALDPAVQGAGVAVFLCDASGAPCAKRVTLGAGDLAFPVRAGLLVRRVRKMMADEDLREKVSVGDFSLVVSENLLVRASDGMSIRLTDKEREILLALERAPGRLLERKALLDAVWQYADGVETHTLETHIYRLRQKIEPDPGNPSILVTEGTGYRLS